MEKRGHSMDILFPLGLLAGFAAAVIAVLLMTAGVYRGNVERSGAAFSGPTALSYVTEKLHQSDENGSVSLGSIDGCSAIILSSTYADAVYDTYIYCWDGSLRELMVKREVTPEARMGRSLLPLKTLTAEPAGEGLLRITCEDESKTLREAYVSLRSGEGSLWN